MSLIKKVIEVQTQISKEIDQNLKIHSVLQKKLRKMSFKCGFVLIIAIAALLGFCNGECQQAEDYPVFVDDGEYLCAIQYPVNTIFH
jgi:hypothetical protein